MYEGESFVIWGPLQALRLLLVVTMIVCRGEDPMRHRGGRSVLYPQPVGENCAYYCVR